MNVESVSRTAVKWNCRTLVFLPKSMVSRTGTSVKLVLLMLVPKIGSFMDPKVNLLELYAERLSATCSCMSSRTSASGLNTSHSWSVGIRFCPSSSLIYTHDAELSSIAPIAAMRLTLRKMLKFIIYYRKNYCNPRCMSRFQRLRH